MKSYFYFAFLLTSNITLGQTTPSKPIIYSNNSKTVVADGSYINCLKINDLSCSFYLTNEMKSYDEVKLELHRFGEGIDILAATKTFLPSTKEFQKKFAKVDSAQFKILAEENDFSGSDFQPNTLIFPVNSTTNMAFCKSHDLKNCSWYVVVRGYKKTGEKTQFNEDVFDKGTDLSAKSVVFKSWESKTK